MVIIFLIRVFFSILQFLNYKTNYPVSQPYVSDENYTSMLFDIARKGFILKKLIIWAIIMAIL
jgi:hypothetical protein